MKIGSSRSGKDDLDRLLAKKKYDKALEVIEKALSKNPNQLNLRLRQADTLDLAGHRKKAIENYRVLAEAQAKDGFYARAIAIYKKILRLDPKQTVHHDLARLIEEDQQSKAADRDRRKSGTTIGQEQASIDQELKELKASKLFSSFERETLVEIIASTELRSYEVGDTIVTEGERGSSLFLIVDGTVKVFTGVDDGSSLQLAELSAGDFFGEVSLLSDKPRTATITACTQVTAIELERESVDRIAATHPEVRKVLEDFYERRAKDTVEAVIRSLRTPPEPPPAAPRSFTVRYGGKLKKK